MLQRFFFFFFQRKTKKTSSSSHSSFFSLISIFLVRAVGEYQTMLVVGLVLLVICVTVDASTPTSTLPVCIGSDCCGVGTIYTDGICSVITSGSRSTPDGFAGLVVLGVLTAFVVVGVVSTAAATLTEAAPSFPAEITADPTELNPHGGWEVQGAKEVFIQTNYDTYSNAIRNRFPFLKAVFTDIDIAELYHEKLGSRGFVLQQDSPQQVELVVFQDGRRLWFPSSVLCSSPYDPGSEPLPDQIPSASVTPALTAADNIPPTPATLASLKPLPRIDSTAIPS